MQENTEKDSEQSQDPEPVYSKPLGDLHITLPWTADVDSRNQLSYVLEQVLAQGVRLGNIQYFGKGEGHEIRMSDMVKKEIRKNFLTHCIKERDNKFQSYASKLDTNPELLGHKFGYSAEHLISTLRASDCFNSVGIEPEVVPLTFRKLVDYGINDQPIYDEEVKPVLNLKVYTKPKSSYHLSFKQMFDKEGNISMTYSGGFRNVLGHLETWNYAYQKSLQKEKLSQKNLSVNFPIFYNGTELGLNWHDGSSTLDETIIEHKKSKSVNLKIPVSGKVANIKLAHEWRSNIFDPDDVSFKMLDEEIIPSSVIKGGLDFNLVDDYSFDQTSGKINWQYKLDLEFERVFGDCSYLKTGFNQNMSVDLKYGVEKLKQTMGMKSSLDLPSGSGLKKVNGITVPFKKAGRGGVQGGKKLARKPSRGLNFFKIPNMQIQNTFKGQMISGANPEKMPKINDLIHLNKPRGYDRVGPREPIFNSSKHPFTLADNLKYLGSNHGAYLSLQNSTKYKFLDFPFLSGGGGKLGIFWHHSSYYLNSFSSVNNLQLNRGHWKHSAGIGFGLNAGVADLEFLYNFAHSSKGGGDKPGWFQVRFALGD